MEAHMLRSIVLPLVVVATAAAAQEPQPAARFVFVPVEQGTLRLDTATGAVSLCAGGADALACRPLPDEARAAEEETEKLAQRVETLERRIAALERKGPASEPFDAEAMDRAAVLAERMMRRFFGMVRDMKRDFEQEEL
jgi:hypothetical protein